MTAQIIDGKAIAEQIRREVGEGVAELLAAGKPRPGTQFEGGIPVV